jgi:hypothetical protein
MHMSWGSTHPPNDLTLAGSCRLCDSGNGACWIEDAGTENLTLNTVLLGIVAKRAGEHGSVTGLLRLLAAEQSHIRCYEWPQML